MKTIKSKILRPYIIFIIIIPLATLFLFNIAMRMYVARTARADIAKTVETMAILVRNKIGDNVSDELLNEPNNTTENLYNYIAAASRVSRVSLNTQLYLFNRNLVLMYPQPGAQSDSTADLELVEDLREKLPYMEKNKIYPMKLAGERYMAASIRIMPNRPQNRTPYLVFVSSTKPAMGFIYTIDIILVGIMSVGILIGLLFALQAAGGISKSLTALCGYAKKIGNGNFVQVPLDNSSREILELSQNMNEMSHRLSNYDSTQKAFLQNASHEIRTPLMSIQGYAEGIANDVLPDYKAAANIICEESRRLNKLVEGLLMLSGIENQTVSGHLEQINLPDSLREYVQRVNGFAIKENKLLKAEIPDNKILVKADDNLLGQAVTNILSNCIRHAASTVTLTLSVTSAVAADTAGAAIAVAHTAATAAASASASAKKAVIRVYDDGPGIDQKDLPHIFERFYKGTGGNSGLGLSIAQSAIKYMNGSIRAGNMKTGGAEFVIELPCTA